MNNVCFSNHPQTLIIMSLLVIIIGVVHQSGQSAGKEASFYVKIKTILSLTWISIVDRRQQAQNLLRHEQRLQCCNINSKRTGNTLLWTLWGMHSFTGLLKNLWILLVLKWAGQNGSLAAPKLQPQLRAGNWGYNSHELTKNSTLEDWKNHCLICWVSISAATFRW